MSESTENIALNAVKALLYEVTTTPKPGLVDPASAGAHPDMDAFMFIDSALSLQKYFTVCATHGSEFSGDDLRELFGQIRTVGVQAERVMFSATNNVNTHKGAVFSLGVVVTAYAYQINHPELTIMEIVQRMLTDLTKNDFAGVESKTDADLTAGEREYLKYGITGIRGEAEAGFPTVFSWGIPALKLAHGTTNQKLLTVLMTIVQHSVDTNLIKRAGTDEIISWVQAQADRFFELGGSTTDQGMQLLIELDQTFTDRMLSLGGSADLLILTIFIGLQENII